MNKKATLMLVVVIGITGLAIISQSESAATAATERKPINTQATSAQADNQTVTLKPLVDHSALSDAPLSSDYVMGSKDAPITLVEYASLSCPHCAAFHNKVLPQLKEQYINTGKLRYILRQFPLNESALGGAMLVHCVGETGGSERYYQFNNVLFGAQKKWAFDVGFKQSLKVFAEVGGVSAEKFEACLNNIEQEKEILLTRKTAGEELKVDSTPYIFLNGHPHNGDRSFEAVQKEIEAILKTSR